VGSGIQRRERGRTEQGMAEYGLKRDDALAALSNAAQMRGNDPIRAGCSRAFS
jgi:hypothetical protein